MIRMIRKGIALALALAMIALMGQAALADQKGTVRGGWLLLRNAPSYQGKVLSSYPTGTVVSVNSQSGGWYGVTAPDGLQGYMLGSYLNLSGGGGTLPAGSAGYVTSQNGLNVRLRTGPGTGYAVTASYAPGTACTVLGTEGGWYRIQIGSYTGYMMARFVTGTAPGPSPAPAPSPSGQTDVWVTSANGKGVYLREGAGKNYAAVGFYPVGTVARTLQFGSTWSYVQIGTRTGWMMTRFLTTVKPVTPTPAPGPSPVSGSYVISGNGRNVNLRSGPGIQFNALAAFPPGTPLSILTRGIQWDYIQINGMYGYMMRNYIYEGNANPASISNDM